MPDYWDAKDAVIEFLDQHAIGKELASNYLKPTSKPKYKASTPLADLDLGTSAMTRKRGDLNAFMTERFKARWGSGLGVIDIKEVATIGDLIKRVAGCLEFRIPGKEPT